MEKSLLLLLGNKRRRSPEAIQPNSNDKSQKCKIICTMSKILKIMESKIEEKQFFSYKKGDYYSVYQVGPENLRLFVKLQINFENRIEIASQAAPYYRFCYFGKITPDIIEDSLRISKKFVKKTKKNPIDLATTVKLESIFKFWNRDDRPCGQTATSLSIGHIVVLNLDGNIKAYMVDNFGFKIASKWLNKRKEYIK